MDELDLIRRFRDHVPAPSPAARARAMPRARRAAVRRRRVLVPLAGTAAIVAVAAPLIGSSGDGTLAPTGTALAAKQLRDVAAVAERQPDPRAIGPGQYWYQRSYSPQSSMKGWREGDPSPKYWFVQSYVRETWIDRDGAGLIRSEPRGGPRFPAERDRRRWREAGSPTLGEPFEGRIEVLRGRGAGPGFDLGSIDLGAERVSFDELVNLPTDPDALYERLQRAAQPEIRAGSYAPDALFLMVQQLLTSAPIPSELRAALYRVVAKIPTVRPLGEMRDVADRPGIGVEIHAGHGIRRALIFDPDTAEPLGYREGPATYAIDGNDPEAGTGYGETAYLEEGVVDEIGQRP